MSKLEKAIQRLKSIPRDYAYAEAKYILGQFGFYEDTKGKTSGSRVEFFRPSDGASISFHKPHPSNILSRANVRDLLNFLEGLGEI